MTYYIGIDVGGTFTDFSVFDERTQALIALKTPSTPPDFAAAVVEFATHHAMKQTPPQNNEPSTPVITPDR